MRHLMLDVETMGLGPRSAPWQLAIREFEITDTAVQLMANGFFMDVLLDQTEIMQLIRRGNCTFDSSTFLWSETQPNADMWMRWASQTDGLLDYDTAARYKSKLAAIPVTPLPFTVLISEVQRDIMQDLFDPSATHFWSKGKEFDKTIMDNLFKSAGLKTPWAYYNFHCVRDAFGLPDLFRNKQPERRKATTHNAWDDCREQVGLLNEAYQAWRARA